MLIVLSSLFIRLFWNSADFFRQRFWLSVLRNAFFTRVSLDNCATNENCKHPVIYPRSISVYFIYFWQKSIVYPWIKCRLFLSRFNRVRNRHMFAAQRTQYFSTVQADARPRWLRGTYLGRLTNSRTFIERSFSMLVVLIDCSGKNAFRERHSLQNVCETITPSCAAGELRRRTSAFKHTIRKRRRVTMSPRAVNVWRRWLMGRVRISFSERS